MKKWLFVGLLFLIAGCEETTVEVQVSSEDAPRPVRVVVVAMFEIGEDEGDRPGEFQLWKERREYTEILPFHGYKDLHYNEDEEFLVMVTGIGTARAAAATMALGMADRFDLTSAYWLILSLHPLDRSLQYQRSASRHWSGQSDHPYPAPWWRRQRVLSQCRSP